MKILLSTPKSLIVADILYLYKNFPKELKDAKTEVLEFGMDDDVLSFSRGVSTPENQKALIYQAFRYTFTNVFVALLGSLPKPKRESIALNLKYKPLVNEVYTDRPLFQLQWDAIAYLKSLFYRVYRDNLQDKLKNLPSRINASVKLQNRFIIRYQQKNKNPDNNSFKEISREQEGEKMIALSDKVESFIKKLQK